MTYQTVISPIKKRESAAATDFSSSISQVVAPLLEALQPILPHNGSMLHSESKSQKIYEILDRSLVIRFFLLDRTDYSQVCY